MNRPSRIEPRTLKGFRDYLPATMIPRERIIDIARHVYRSYGFSPIDTPALEYLDILTGKGGEETDKQLYRFQDSGGRSVGMRFDLTVPLARFVAQHANELGMPFKRYHIATVWRGENTQHGRYREFMQCDFDTIGTTSVTSDIETVLVMHDLLRSIGFDRFHIHLNNRQVLRGLLERTGLTEQAVPVLRAIDKLPKIGPEKVAAEIAATAGATPEQAADVLKLVTLAGSNEDKLAALCQSGGRQRDGRSRRRATQRNCGRRHGRRTRAASARIGRINRPWPGLLHRRGVRNVPRRSPQPGKRLLGGALRQSGRAVHQPAVAGRGRLAGAGPVVGRHGGIADVAAGFDAGGNLHSLFRRRPVARVSELWRRGFARPASASNFTPSQRSWANN